MRFGSARIATAATLAAVLFGLGALGLGGSPAHAPETGAIAVRPGAALLGPATASGGPDGAIAIASLEDRVQAVPGDWHAAASLGIAYLHRARATADPALYPLAEAALSRSLSIRPHDNPDALVGLGSLAAARHDFVTALRWGRRGVAMAPFDADAYGVVGDALLELGRYPAAFRAFQRMVDTRPDLASYSRVSYARELRGDVDGAIEAMRAAHVVAGSRGDAAWTAASVGNLHLGAGRIAQAETWFRRARAADPSSIEAEAGLASVAWASGDLDRALAGYERVVRRFPAPEFVAVLADLYAEAGQSERAEGHRELVRAEATLFRANGVETDLEIALFEADHAEGGSARTALRAARAEWSRRKSVHVADALAWALFANGRFREASRYADRALRLGTRSALFLFHAGMIHLRLGEVGGAERLLRRAFDVNPYFSVRWSPVLRDTLARFGGA